MNEIVGEQTVPIEKPEVFTEKPYGKDSWRMVKGKWVKSSEFRNWFIEKKFAREVHSDGFLALGGVTRPAYECKSCGFNGFFESDTCHKCGSLL